MKLFASYQVQCWQTVLCFEIANFLYSCKTLAETSKTTIQLTQDNKAFMKFKLRQESLSDHSAIADLILETYRDVPYSNHKEQIMVERLRNSNAFIPTLSIVAENENKDLIGHILLTKIQIQNHGQSYEALALAPLSISPIYQKKEIGKKLILESHRIAKELGYNYIVVLGIPNYYPKFGYQFTSIFNISLPIKISEENALIISLTGNNYPEITGGTVIYSKEFFG